MATGFQRAVKQYTKGYAHMFSGKFTKLQPPHRPYSVLINLKTMQLVSADPRGKYREISQFIQDCKSIQ